MLDPTKSDKAIGIVVIGRNEGDRLKRCLASLSEYGSSLAYVDSGSTDGSQELARDMGSRLIELDMSLPFTAARARHMGYSELKKILPELQFIQFIDGDCKIQPYWIETASSFLVDNPDIAIVCGRRREQNPEASVYNMLCDREWDTQVGETSACGGDSLVRSAAYEDAGGFDGRLIAGEEPELCVRMRELGWKIWRLDAEMTQHDAAMTRFEQWWRRSIRSGHAFAEVSRLHAQSPKQIWKRETLSAVFWAGVLPVAIVVAGIVSPVLFANVLIYPVQIARIAVRETKMSGLNRWAYAVFLVMGKFPELQGILTYYTRRLFGRTSTLIEYKVNT